MEKTRGRRPYKKCLSLVVKTYELLIDDEDAQHIIEELATLRKRLNEEEKAVVDKLAKGMKMVTVVEIDEASPGSDLSMKM